jgi:hypothetical protein
MRLFVHYPPVFVREEVKKQLFESHILCYADKNAKVKLSLNTHLLLSIYSA